MGDQSISDLLYATDDQTAQQRASALAAALRGQQQQAQRMQFQGNLGAAFDNPVLAAVGKAYATTGTNSYADAQRQLEEIPGVSEKRMLLTREKAKDASQESYQKGELANRNQQLADERAFHKAQLEQSKFAPLQQGGRTYNTKTGELGEAEGAPKPPPGGGGALKEGDWKTFIEKMNSGGARSGELGANQKRINTAQRLQQLYTDPTTGGVRDLDKREIPEMAIGLQNLLSPGGHSTAEIEHLIPETYQGNVQGFLEKLTNEPRGQGMQAFIQKMAHTVEREKKAAEDSNKSMRLEQLPGYTPYAKANQARFEGILRGHGIDPASLDENLLPRGAAAVSRPAGGAASPGADYKRATNKKTGKDGWLNPATGDWKPDQ